MTFVVYVCSRATTMMPPSSLPCCWLLSAAVLLLYCMLPSSYAVSYNAYNYDLTTPMFTPDGRLLQVEYAGRASDWSSPMVVLKCNDDTTILMTCRRSVSRGAQDRIVVLEGGGIDDGNAIVVGMNGVLADSLNLLSQVQRETEKELRLYGKAATLSSLQLANILGNACQSHAFGGGIRPYGSNMIVCDCACVYQTDPSGAVKQRFTDAENDKLLVVGGSESRQAQVKSEICKKVLSSKDLDLSETLQRLAKILLKEDADKTNDADNDKRQQKWLEVAVLSPTHGVHRLTDLQIQALIQAANGNTSKKTS